MDTPGENILVEFPSVVDGTKCAVEIQRAIGMRNARLSDDRKMQFRIGINLGDVIEEEARIYGDGVDIAARVRCILDFDTFLCLIRKLFGRYIWMQN